VIIPLYSSNLCVLSDLPGGLVAPYNCAAANATCNFFMSSWNWSALTFIVLFNSWVASVSANVFLDKDVFVFVRMAIAIVAKAVKNAERAMIISVIFISSIRFIFLRITSL